MAEGNGNGNGDRFQKLFRELVLMVLASGFGGFAGWYPSSQAIDKFEVARNQAEIGREKIEREAQSARRELEGGLRRDLDRHDRDLAETRRDLQAQIVELRRDMQPLSSSSAIVSRLDTRLDRIESLIYGRRQEPQR